MKKLLLLPLMAALATACGTPSGQSTTSDAAPFAADTALTTDQIAARKFTPEVMLKMGRLGSSTLSPDGSKILYTLTYMSVSQDKSYTALWVMDADGANASRITKHDIKVGEPTWNADGSRIYFLADGQLHSIAVDGSDLQKMTTIEQGVNGYGISPDGKNAWLAIDVQVEDVTGAQRYKDREKSSVLIYDELMCRHWDTWEDGKYSHIFVGEVKDGKVAEIKDIMPTEAWDAPVAPYFDNAEITWNNSSTAVAYTCRKLTGYEYSISTNTDIYYYTLADGVTRNLTEGMPGYDKYPRFSPDDTKMAWQSMERAGNESDKDRLMVLDLSTNEKLYATMDFDYNASDIRWNGNNSLYFLSPIEATVQLCEAKLPESLTSKEGLSVKMVTQGLHDYVSLSVAGGKIIAEKTTISMASETFALDAATGKDTQLTFINKHIYDNVDMGEVEKRWVATTDGKQMLTWIITPPNAKKDGSVKYPTLLYCQGGPQSVVSQRWSYRWNYQLMAAQGYVIVAPNRRGLPSFGQEWLDQISGDYSGQNIRDYFSAIDNATKDVYVDADRLGCVGASYGGYSVYYIAGHHNKRFKSFISHCGIFDFTSMYGSTEELWFVNNDYGGAYWDKDNATAMRSYANSPHHFVNNWDTPIMIITGLKDYRIPYTQSLEAFTAARAHGIEARLVAFEDEAHQVFKSQNALIWHHEFFSWLDKYLKK